MIIKGKSRSGPRALAAHLGNAEKNERVTLLQTKGVLSKDLLGALVEMDAYAAGTKATKSLYHAALSPEPPHRLSIEQREEAINALEEKLGLTGHARVVVMHEKLGREHFHIVWTRVNLATMKVVADSHNYRKHEEVARDLERRFGHNRVQGAHHERDGKARPQRTPSRAELRQEERTGITGKQVLAEVTAAYLAADNAQAFVAALKDNGYTLARGDYRDFVLIDRKGGTHSLARRLDGVNTAELRKYMEGLDPKQFPSIGDAKRATAAGTRETELAEIEAKKATKREKSYTGGADYVSQTTAALKDFNDRQKKLNRTENDAVRTFDYKKLADDETRQSNFRQIKRDGRRGSRDHTDDDRQPRAPGGGRTRSR